MEANVVLDPLEVGRSISNLGFMIIATAIYLSVSAGIIFFFIRWVVRIIDLVINKQQGILEDILEVQNELVALLREGDFLRFPPKGRVARRAEAFSMSGE